MKKMIGLTVVLLMLGLQRRAMAATVSLPGGGGTLTPIPGFGTGPDPTTIDGLFWYSKDTLPEMVVRGSGTPLDPSQPLPVETTAFVALQLGIRYPDPNTTWDILFTRPDGTTLGTKLTYTLGTDGLQCLNATVTDSRSGATGSGSNCGYSLIGFDLANYVSVICNTPGLWSVTLSSSDGAAFSGDFTMTADIRAHLDVASTSVQVAIPSDADSAVAGGYSVPGAPYNLPAVPAGTTTVSIIGNDPACPALALSNMHADISLTPLDNTGGHQHPVAILQQLTPPLIALTPGALVSELFASGNTDSSGKLQVTFTAGEASADYRVEGEVFVNGTALKPDNQPVVHVGDLNGQYVATSGAGLDMAGQTAAHPNNHYIQPTTDAAIAALSQAWHTTTLFSTCGNLGLNDASLERGGIFDIDATLEPPHVLHRRGIEFDVNIPSVCNVPLVRLLMRKRVKDIGKMAHLATFPEPTIHFRPL